MLDIRSSNRRVARFMVRPTLVRINRAMGTSTRNISVNCQLIQQANTTQPSARSGSATTRPNSVLVPCPTSSMSLVKRAISSLLPCSLN